MVQCPPAFLENYSLVKVAGDGNCFYRAVAMQLFLDPNFHLAIRVVTAVAFLQFPKLFQAILKGNQYDSYTQNFKRIITNREWATSVTILATAIGVGRSIYMYTDFGPLTKECPPIPTLPLLQLFLDEDPRCNRHVTYNHGVKSAPLTLFYRDFPGHFVPCLKLRSDSTVFPPSRNFFGRVQKDYSATQSTTLTVPISSVPCPPSSQHKKLIANCTDLIYKVGYPKPSVDEIFFRFTTRSPVIRNVLTLISSASPTHLFDFQLHDVDEQLSAQCDPLFLRFYTPVSVGHTGNCFYESIAMLLFNNLAFHPLIRVATVFKLLEHRPMFEEFLKLNNDSSFHDTLLSAVFNDGWADQTTMKASSLAIGRDVYIYEDFRANNNGKFLPSRTTDTQFSALFLNGDGCIMQHATYESERTDGREPLTICHHSAPGHFAPALKNNPGVPVFRPPRIIFHLRTT